MAKSENTPSKTTAAASEAATKPEFVPAPTSSTNPLAIVSLVTGVLGITFVPFFASVAAVVTGHFALHQIKLKQEQGRGMALAGLVTGYAGLAFTLLALIALFGFIFMIIQMGGFDVVFDGNDYRDHGPRMPMRGGI